MADLKKISLNGKKGYYRSSDSSIVIAPQYDDCIDTFGIDSYNHMEYAPVSLNGKCGMIHESGDIIIPIEYQEVVYLFDNYFAVRKELPGKEWSYGVIKPDGTVVVPFEYKMINKVGRFFECFKEAGSSRIYTHTLFDTKGRIFEYFGKMKPVVYNCNGDIIYDGYAIDSKFDYLIVNKGDKYGVVDQYGKLIVAIEYDDVILVSPNRIIVRRGNGNSWLFGVVDSKSNIIIDFKYKYITSNNGAFFDCFKESESSLQFSRSHGERYEYSNKKQEVWLNSIGEEVYQGEAEVLSEELLACDKNGKKGVFNYCGKRIINFLYDSIRLLDNYLIVEKDSKVGVLSDSGNVVIDALYNNIEFVHIDDYYFRYRNDKLYGSFSKNNVFDTASEKDHLNRQLIQFVKNWGFLYYTGISCPIEHYSFNDIMILRTDSYAELFSIEEGIIPNSRFDTVKQLTDLSYVVSKNGKYGVYRRDVHRLIIDCEFERIIFEGGHVVLLCKDGLWGAKTMVLPEHPMYPLTKSDVPIQYKEISILNSSESLYGVKHERTNNMEETIEEYTIVDAEGKEYEKMNDFWGLSSMPVLYDLNHILTSRNEKFGFVSVRGYESVPFIYDEIIERDDSLFDVRIADCWGVIDVYGKTIVSIKYNAQIKGNGKFDNLLVIDTLSKRKGVLGADGREKIPAVYEHLMIQDKIIYCGRGGYEYNFYYNFFCKNIVEASWGVYTKEGVPIIEPLYDCFKEKDGYILAGRDGGFLRNGRTDYDVVSYEEYSGVYDLYDYDGNLILGGFNKFYKDNDLQLLYFHFGGRWEQEYEDDYECFIGFYSYDFEEGNGRWLVTDMNLTSIIPKQDNTKYTFPKGSKCTITKKKENGKTTNYWSFPLELFSIEEPVSFNGFLLIGDYNSQRVIRIEDKVSSLPYTKLKVIDSKIFFTYKKEEKCSGVGIASIDKELISCNEQYLLLTYPVSEYVFAVKKIDDNYKVLLINIMNPVQIITAIDKINYSDMAKLLRYDKLQILTNEVESDIECITVRDKSVFDNSFITSIKVEESDVMYEKEKQYWFSVDLIINIDNIFGSYENNWDDDCDYRRESWDAMTDGMYGDMPDDFDGDYSFMGY